MNQECFLELVKLEMVIKYPGLKLRGEVNMGGVKIDVVSQRCDHTAQTET